MTLIILSHPCAGKTYLAKKEKKLTDVPSGKGKKEGKIIAITKGHTKYKSYDVAMILNDKDFNRNIKSRMKNSKGKVFKEESQIRKARDETRKLAEKLGLPIYDSFEKIIKKYG